MKKRKPHSLKKRRQKIADASLKNLVIVHVSGSKFARLYDVKLKRFVQAYAEIDRALRDLNYHWSCLIAIFCHDHLRKQDYMKSEIIISKEKVNRERVVDIFVEQHQALIDSANSSHYRGYGWIASPSGIDISEEAAVAMFSEMDAWRVRSEAEVAEDLE